MGTYLKNTLPLLVLLVILQIPVMLPLFQDGYYTSHDDFSVQRIVEYRTSILAGDIPARWSANLLYGYGYPLFIFYSPLVYAVGAVITLIGITPLTAVKVISMLSIIGGTTGVFMLTRQLTKNGVAAFAASVIYAYAPYRATDLYVRGAIAEFVGLSLLPWLLYTLWLTIKNARVTTGILHGILLGAFITTHHITTMIFAMLYVPFTGYALLKNKSSFGRTPVIVGVSLLVALGISCWYWVPLLVESHYINTTSLYAFPLNFFLLTVSGLWDSPWGYGGVLDADPMSLQIGKSLFLIMGLLTAGIPYLLYKRLYTIVFWLGIFFAFGFLELKASAFIWDSVPLLHVLRIPWRLHMVLITIGAMLTAMAIDEFCRRARHTWHYWISQVVIVTVILLTITTQVQFFRPKIFYTGYYPHETTTWDDEYLPKWVKQKPMSASPGTQVISGKATISYEKGDYLNKQIALDVYQPAVLEFPVIWYHGWLAQVDGKSSKISVNQPYGTVLINVPAGKHAVTLRFNKTWWRITAEAISVGTLIGVAAFLTHSWLDQYKKHRRRR